jgi:hypothetical protein
MKIRLNELGRRIGECHPRAKLTDEEIELVFQLLEDGMSMQHVADKFEVSKGCIWKIWHGFRRAQVAARVVSVVS